MDMSWILDDKIKQLENLIYDYNYTRHKKSLPIIMKSIYWNLGFIQGFLKAAEKYNVNLDIQHYITRMSAIYSWLQKNG